jgi:hypothetical protein
MWDMGNAWGVLFLIGGLNQYQSMNAGTQRISCKTTPKPVSHRISMIGAPGEAQDGTAEQTVERHLASAKYDCVVIGAGVRLPPQSLADFEAIINAVHKAAPTAAIAFNRRPEDSADAAARRLPSG